MAVQDDPRIQVDSRLQPPIMGRPHPDDAVRRAAPPIWRVWRLIAALLLVLTGLAMIIVTVAFIYWPADLILAGVAMLVLGAFFVRIEPRPPERR